MTRSKVSREQSVGIILCNEADKDTQNMSTGLQPADGYSRYKTLVDMPQDLKEALPT